MTRAIPADPAPTRKLNGSEISASSRVKTIELRPATNPSMAFSTVSRVWVLVRMTATARAKATKKAGPVKSTTPFMKFLLISDSPRPPAIPVTSVITMNIAVSSGSHQPSSHANALVTDSWVTGSTATLFRIEPQGTIEKASRTKVKPVIARTILFRPVNGSTVTLSACRATSASVAEMPTSEADGSVFTLFA